MKFNNLALTAAFVSTLIISAPVLAVSDDTAIKSSPSGIRKFERTIQNKLEKVRENVKEKIESKVENRKNLNEATGTAKVRNSIIVRENVFSKVVVAMGNLLDRLQTRIDRAKDVGKDVSSMKTLMADARAKLADAKLKLEGIDSKKGEVTDKAGFKALQAEFQAVRKDIHAVKEDVSKIIRQLKGFNSATSSAATTSVSR